MFSIQTRPTLRLSRRVDFSSRRKLGHWTRHRGIKCSNVPERKMVPITQGVAILRRVPGEILHRERVVFRGKRGVLKKKKEEFSG